MKKLLYLVLVFTIPFLSCSVEELDRDENPAVDLTLIKLNNWEMAEEILIYINEYRKKYVLEPLLLDRGLPSALSVLHCQEMIDDGKISHINFGYRRQTLIENGAKKVGENVARGYNDMKDLMEAWLNSPSHRNIIEGDFTNVGFGIIQDAKGTYYFTNIFYKK